MKRFARLVHTTDYDPAARWIQRTVNDRVHSSAWPWLWVWYVLLSLVLILWVFSGADRIYVEDYSVLHRVSFSDLEYGLGWQEALAAENTTGYDPGSCAVRVQNGSATALLSALGMDGSSFTAAQLVESADRYLWCLADIVCWEKAAAVKLYGALLKGCSFAPDDVLHFVRFEACDEIHCDAIARV